MNSWGPKKSQQGKNKTMPTETFTFSYICLCMPRDIQVEFDNRIDMLFINVVICLSNVKC